MQMSFILSLLPVSDFPSTTIQIMFLTNLEQLLIVYSPFKNGSKNSHNSKPITSGFQDNPIVECIFQTLLVPSSMLTMLNKWFLEIQ